MHIHNVRDFPHGKLGSKINASFLLKEHGDLYFLVHNFGVHIILSVKKLKKKLFERKKDIAESMHKTVTRGCKFMTLKTMTRGTF